MKFTVVIVFIVIIMVVPSAFALCSTSNPACTANPVDGCDVRQSLTFNSLTFNLPSGIDVCASSIVLNCNGATLVGQSFATGIYITNVFSYLPYTSGVTIQNCNLQGYYEGIRVVNSVNNILANNVVSQSVFAGISLIGSNYTTLSGNAVSNAQNGISLSNARFNTLFSNTLLSNAYGILLTDSHNNSLDSNQVTFNNQTGIRLAASSANRLVQNTVLSNALYGIEIAGSFLQSAYNNLTSNIVSQNQGHGIRLLQTGQNILMNNAVNYNLYGIQSLPLSSLQSNNTFIGNIVVKNNGYGITITGGRNVVVGNNASENNGTGIYIFSAFNQSIAFNYVFGNAQNGIQVIGIQGNTSVIGNTAVNNTLNGITIYGGFLPINVSLNTAIGNNGSGLTVGGFHNSSITNNYAARNKGGGIGVGAANDQNDFIAANIAEDNGLPVFLTSGISIGGSNNTVVNNTALRNANNGFVIGNANNVTLNIADQNGNDGFYIVGAGNLLANNTARNNHYRGIHVIFGPHVIINNLAQGNAYGMMLESLFPGSLVTGNVLQFNNFSGMYVYGANNVTIGENQMVGNNWSGIRMVYTVNSSVMKNNISRNLREGIFVEFNSFYNTIAGNLIQNNSGSGVTMNGINTTFSNNTVVGNGLFGMNLSAYNPLYAARENAIDRNVFMLNARGGMFLGNATANNVTNNVFSKNFGAGVFIDGSSATRLFGNNITNNSNQGLVIRFSNNSVVSNNSISYNQQEGIFVNRTYYGVVANNTVLFNNGSGIHVANSMWLNISKNVVFLSANDGLMLSNNVSLNSNFGFNSYHLVDSNVVCFSRSKDLVVESDNNSFINNSCNTIKINPSQITSENCAFNCEIGGRITVQNPDRSQNILGLQNITVELHDKDGNTLALTKTNASGYYNFSDENSIVDYTLNPQNLSILALLSDSGENFAPNYYINVFKDSTQGAGIVFLLTKNFTLSSGQNRTKNILFSDSEPMLALSSFKTKGQLNSSALVYYHLYRAINFTLNQLAYNLNFAMPLDTYVWSFRDSQYHSQLGMPPSTIYLNQLEMASLNDRIIVTILWHEFGHHVAADLQLLGIQGTPPLSTGDCNHCGILNSNSQDSLEEGFAHFYAMLVANQTGINNAFVYYSSLGLLHMEMGCKVTEYEEFAFASMLWDLFDGVDAQEFDYVQVSPKTLLDILFAAHPTTIYDAYLALNASAIPQFHVDTGNLGFTDLDKLFIRHFFYDNASGNLTSFPDIGLTSWNSQYPHRHSFKVLPGSYVNLTFTDKYSGQHINTVKIYEFQNYAPPYDSFDIAYQRVLHNTTQLPIVMPSTLANASLELVFSAQGYLNSSPLIINNTFYWSKIAPLSYVQNPISALFNLSIQLEPVVSLSLNASPQIGTDLGFSIRDANNPGFVYILLFSLGNSTGILLPDGSVFPLDLDDVLLLTLNSPASIGLFNSVGVLNNTGQAHAAFVIPNVPQLAGITFYAAFGVINPANGSIVTISNALPITLQ